MITYPVSCSEGTCNHAPYPHRLVTTSSEVIVRTGRDGKPILEEREGRMFVVCAACGCWDRSGAKARCGCGCHTAVIPSGYTVGTDH
jgi:hypothetical protein